MVNWFLQLVLLRKQKANKRSAAFNFKGPDTGALFFVHPVTSLLANDLTSPLNRQSTTPIDMMKILLTFILTFLFSFLNLQAAHHASKAKVNLPDGFVALFDGKSKDGWFTNPRGAQEVWKVDPKTGALARSLQNGYIWTEKEYGDFILDLEYKLSRGCNSGVFYRTDPNNPVQGGFEIQLLDSQGVDRGKHDHGAIYDAVAPSSKPAGKVGDWDKLRLRVKGDIVRVWVNGVKVSEADLSKWTTAQKNPDGSKNKFKTALNDLPKMGHIGFQDHGHNVLFRNVFLKEL